MAIIRGDVRNGCTQEDTKAKPEETASEFIYPGRLHKNSSSTNGTLARLAFLNLTVTDYNNIFTRITVVYSTFFWHKVMLKNAKKVESSEGSEGSQASRGINLGKVPMWRGAQVWRSQGWRVKTSLRDRQWSVTLAKSRRFPGSDQV